MSVAELERLRNRVKELEEKLSAMTVQSEGTMLKMQEVLLR